MVSPQAIRAEMRVTPEMDCAHELHRRVHFIQQQVQKAGARALVLGVSGGVDSCTCGRLAQLAVTGMNVQHPGRADYRFIALRLPYARQQDADDVTAVLDFIAPDVCLEVNIAGTVDALHSATLEGCAAAGLALPDAAALLDHARGNVKARARMVVQYEVAALVSGLVLGTDHSAENVTGFYTKYGDGACDLVPLFGLSKRQVRALATHLQAPQEIIDKVPTADLESLRPGHPDEQALGLRYADIDDFLEGRPVSREVEQEIINCYIRTQHKRRAIPTIYDGQEP